MGIDRDDRVELAAIRHAAEEAIASLELSVRLLNVYEICSSSGKYALSLANPDVASLSPRDGERLVQVLERIPGVSRVFLEHVD